MMTVQVQVRGVLLVPCLFTNANAMNTEKLRSYCLGFPGATEGIKWEDHLCFMVAEKMFLITGMSDTDNVSIKVNAVIYFRVMQPVKAIVEIENYLMGTSQLSQTTLRSVLGQSELDDLLSQREKINHKLQQIIDSQTEPWGVKVSHVEVKQIDLPQEMQRAMAKQAEAERERRSKVISAEGEYQASQRLADAAKILSEQPSALTLRYLQTLREIATENNSTTIFPVPIDILKPFMTTIDKKPE